MPPPTASADKRLTAAYRAWAEGEPTAEEMVAMGAQKGGAERLMNAAFPDELISPGLATPIAHLQKLLGRGVAPQVMTLHRGVGAAELATLRKAGTGGTIEQPGLVSTSIDAEVAGELVEGGMVANLRVRKGQTVLGAPEHACTQALIAAIPTLERRAHPATMGS